MINFAKREGQSEQKQLNIKKCKKPILVLLVLLIAFGAYYFRNTPLGQLATTIFSPASKKLMNKMKTKGCVADGLLTGFGGDFNDKVSMLGRSKCEFLHRSVETWNNPPNFNQIQQNLNTIQQRTGKKFIYGFFLAEAIRLDADYAYPDENRQFNFNAMCSPGSVGSWGENTCKPSFNQSEYRKYFRYVTRKAIDMGFEDFTIGQVYYQDDRYQIAPVVADVIKEMKDYAKTKGKTIVVGAQTNTIDNEKYLRNFDYITGGVGQDENGNIESGPCWSYLQRTANFCWAMMWNPKYKNKANNILIYLDWNNESSDDMNRFVRMKPETRKLFLNKAYDFFLSKDMGFLMPLEAVLDGSGRGCTGAKPNFYSANNAYSCKDEAVINDILNKSPDFTDDAQFVDVQVPEKMIAGKNYLVKVTMKNNSSRIWSNENTYQLRQENPKEAIWGINQVDLPVGDNILPDQNATFEFQIIAPTEPASYAFQWQMVKDQEEFFGEKIKNVKIQVLPLPTQPSQAIDGPICKDKQLIKCNKWCSEPGATCNAQAQTESCLGIWYDDKSYNRPVDCCVDDDCSIGNQCQNNTCVPITAPLPPVENQTTPATTP